jgi:hypothetical protein
MKNTIFHEKISNNTRFFAFCYKIKRICYMRQRAFSLKTVPLPQIFT